MAAAPHRRAAPGGPPLAALFLVDFDAKAGSTLGWRRAEPGLGLDDGRVEYQALPSGLHAVRRDVVYFVHGAGLAGLSAFANEPCADDAARNARMLAVGLLVPLAHGRLGRAWRHAAQLERLAASLAQDRSRTDLLDGYWQANRARPGSPPAPDAGPPPSPLEPPTLGRVRSLSDGPALPPAEHRLSACHPAWSLTKLLDTFGPLIFPIYRAALLRRRILISCHAPVRQVCDFVYDISVLSNIPLSVSDSLPASSVPPRLRPLFAIGVHDIPFLVEDLEASTRRADGDGAGPGWIACTTDSILAMKDTLWDMLVTLPADAAPGARDRAWPVVECPRGTAVKATQRDLRRYKALRAGLARLAPAGPDSPPSETPAAVADEPLDQLVEPLSWAALAYSGYMWWASAGEQLCADEHEQAVRDAALLAGLGPARPPSPASPRRPSAEPLADSVVSLAPGDPDEARLELALVAYFHRLTAQMLSVLADLVDDADYPESYHDDGGDDDDDDDDDDDEDDDALLRPGANDQPPVAVDSDCVERMGLDVWSAADAAFVRDLVAAYFGRAARVEAKGVEVCGVRVC